MLPRSLSLARSGAAALLLGVLMLLHALFTPGSSHLAAEEPGCPHARITAAAPAVQRPLHGPQPAVAAPAGRNHPEHDPATRLCPGAAATRLLGHPCLPRAGATSATDPLPAPASADPPASRATAPGGPRAVLRQILRC
jgi:hypothetical protein